MSFCFWGTGGEKSSKCDVPSEYTRHKIISLGKGGRGDPRDGSKTERSAVQPKPIGVDEQF